MIIFRECGSVSIKDLTKYSLIQLSTYFLNGFIANSFDTCRMNNTS